MPFEDLTPETQNLLRQKAITVRPLGLQTSDRFGSDDGQRTNDRIPSVREWRLNLTQLSQLFNLYLVAYKDRVYVYEPLFPDQKLPSRPSLIIAPPRTERATAGYLDRECPHSINHLFVDFLGDLEVVLVACDDGDVIGFYMHHVQAAVEARKMDGYPGSLVMDEYPPFFKHNVDMSAWGLSIHSNGRKIAISCNKHTVHVITFGLLGIDRCEELGLQGRHMIPTRTDIIGGFHHNLPSVSFCNTQDDLTGKLLVTGGLTGYTYVHGLEPSPVPLKLLSAGFCRKFGERGGVPACHCPDAPLWPHSTWGVSFIDRHAFRRISGYAPAQMIRDRTYDDYWNGSFMRLCVPESSHTYKVTGNRISTTQRSASISSEDDEDDEYEDEEEDADSDHADDFSLGQSTTTATTGHLPASLQSMTHPWYANVQPVGARSILGRPSYSGKRFSNIVYENEETPRDRQIPANIMSPLVVMSKYDLLLLQPAVPGVGVTPVIALEDPLKQAFDLDHVGHRLPSFVKADGDRLSLHAVIDELGIILIGSPSGRVAVFSLLRTDDWLKRPEGTYFVRLDWILPFANEEVKGMRPERKLVGLAAGPMQGQLGKVRLETRRTWRLMMYYADHSVLSYELSLLE